MSYKNKRILHELWVNEYVISHDGIGGYCKLCGNTGKIHTSPRSPTGEKIGDFISYCICPNGRTIKEMGDK